MTKEAYLEMCEQMGSEPVESEIPIEVSDFPETVQLCLTIYSRLPDTWDVGVGKYNGKDYSLIFKFFELYDIDTKDLQIFMLDIMQSADHIRMEISAERVKTELSQNKSSKQPRK